jgi:phenylalanyl-tRNA synthetase beta chain
MLVPLKWLKEFVDYDVPAQELADRLTMFGLEVEGVIERCAGLDKVIVAKVLGVEPHPDADKLRLARVDTGSEELTIVCGAPNLHEGMKSPLAMVGARLGEDFKVKKAKIRGVESKGMLCSERELGFSDDHSGIMDLDADAPIGQSIIDYFNLETQVLEIGITPNRGDALSILGVARDVAAMLGVVHQDPEIKLEATGKDINQQAGITISDPDLCKRYAARMVNGITIKPSPVWMKDRLMAAGQRPINNIVDVTNYVMLERGQPLHAFDFDGVAGGKIDVRRANEVEKFTTLDNQERRLKKDMLMIWDAEKPVGLAGVMGGLNSEVEDHTKHVLIEAAFFDPISIRRTAKALGLNSEASYRFERTVDLGGCMKAAERAAELMAQLSGATIAKGSIDIYPEPYVPYKLPLSVKYVNQYLGLNPEQPAGGGLLDLFGVGGRGRWAGQPERGDTRLQARSGAHRGPDRGGGSGVWL